MMFINVPLLLWEGGTEEQTFEQTSRALFTTRLLINSPLKLVKDKNDVSPYLTSIMSQLDMFKLKFIWFYERL